MATILLADDDGDAREVLQKLLSSSGHEVVEVDTGEMAVMQASVVQPELIILGADLPDIDGFETLRRLKFDADSSDIPVVVLSGRDDLEDISRALSLGASDYISKPYTDKQIMNSVRSNLPNVR